MLLACLPLLLACDPPSNVASSRRGAPAASAEAGGPAAPAPVPRRTLTYAAIGASDTVGVGAGDPQTEGWVYVLHGRMPAETRLVNLGISGGLLQTSLTRQTPQAIAARPAVVTVWNVVNDLNARVFLSRYEDDLGKLLTALDNETDAQIFVGNVPDLTLVPAYDRADKKTLAAEIQRWNAVIARATGRFPGRVHLVDLYAHSEELALHREYVAADNFHPSKEGHRRLAEVFWEAILRAGGVPQ
jgi:lysophospholipase L1-like esterase